MIRSIVYGSYLHLCYESQRDKFNALNKQCKNQYKYLKIYLSIIMCIYFQPTHHIIKLDIIIIVI